MCDMLWSDPSPIETDVGSGWSANPRGAGFLYGKDMVEKVKTRKSFFRFCFSFFGKMICCLWQELISL
jgi:hypothetical protein